MWSKIWKKRNSERGQGFMELAISLVFLLILGSAMIDLGWAFYTLIALRDATQEAAVYGSMCPVGYNLDGSTYLDEDAIIDRLIGSASAPLDMADLDPADIDVCVIDPTNPPADCAAAPALAPDIARGLRVEAAVQHEIRTPLVASFIGTTTYPLRVDVTDVILRINEIDDSGCD